MNLRRPLAIAVLLFAGYASASAAPPQQATPAQMTVVKDKDVSGSIYKKLGLPSQQYCWAACLKEDQCTGVRWGVIEGSTAGLCILLSGPLTLKDHTVPKTDDGQKIRVTVGMKQTDGARPQ
jgi:hypothetical protein